MARVFQVNQNERLEYEACILCAPDDARGGHELMRLLDVGDVLFHYDSRRQLTHRVSVVEVVDLSDPRLSRFDPLGATRRVSATCVAYSGRHLTQDHWATEFLLGFSRTVRSVSLPNAFPGAQVYLTEMVHLDDTRKALVELARSHAPGVQRSATGRPVRRVVRR